MRKILLLVYLLTFITIEIIAQPCVPISNFPGTQGIIPDAISPAYLDTNYTQTINYKAPLDTNVVFNGLPIVFKIDSLRIVDVIGLPDGITYTCHNNSCMVSGGEIGCATLSGRATQGGVFPLKVVVKTSGKAMIFVPVPQNTIDTNENYILYVFNLTGNKQIISNRASISVFPNPASNVLYISNIPGEGTLIITDLSGRSILSKHCDASTLSVDILEWNKGIYLLTYQNTMGIQHSRFIKN